MALLIKNGIIGTAKKAFRGDVLIEGEKIAAVGECVHCGGAEVIDAAGCYVAPGGVDPHTHVMLRSNGRSVSDGFEAATKAALWGGTTTIAEHPSFAEAGSPLSTAICATLKEAEGRAWTDYGVHLVLQRYDDAIAKELAELVDDGFPTGKFYTTYDGRLCDEEIYPLMRRMKELGGLTLCHCENNAIATGVTGTFKADGKTSAADWPASRPDYCEAEAINRVLSLARSADVPCYIVHLSTAAGLKVVSLARKNGQSVFVESCPQHLLLDDKRYGGENGLDFIMAPPLRSVKDREALWRALGNGSVDTIGTDHCSFSRADKVKYGHSDVFNCPCGVPGIETRLLLLFSEGVLKNRISFEQFVALTATNPANILGFGSKGRIEAGADADIVIIDPKAKKELSVKTLHQKADYTPFEGIEVCGLPRHVILRGRAAVTNGRFVARKPRGILVRRRIEK